MIACVVPQAYADYITMLELTEDLVRAASNAATGSEQVSGVRSQKHSLFKISRCHQGHHSIVRADPIGDLDHTRGSL